jgi:ribosomal protein L22
MDTVISEIKQSVQPSENDKKANEIISFLNGMNYRDALITIAMVKGLIKTNALVVVKDK